MWRYELHLALSFKLSTVCLKMIDTLTGNWNNTCINNVQLHIYIAVKYLITQY